MADLLCAATFNANWRYVKDYVAPRTFSQSYSYNNNILITPQVSSNFGLRYSKSYYGSRWTDSTVPTVSLGVNNDIFRLSFSGSVSRRRGSDLNTVWSRNWSSTWFFPYLSDRDIVSLSLNYGESKSFDEGASRRIDSSSKNWGIALSKKFGDLFGLNYSYSGSSSIDKISDIKGTVHSHSLTVSANRVVGKLSMGINGQFNYSKASQKAKSEGGEARFPVSSAWMWEHPPEGGRIDVGVSFVVEVGDVGVREILFYTDYGIAEKIPHCIKWKVEIKREGEDWEEIADGVVFPYRLPSEVANVSLRFTVSDVGCIAIARDPKVELYKLVLSSSGSVKLTTERASYKLSGNLSYDLDNGTRIAYTCSYGESFPNPGYRTNDFSQNISLNWKKYKLLGIDVNLSHSSKGGKGLPQKETYTYALGLVSEPVETLTFNGGFTHMVERKSGRRVSSTDTYYFGVDALLYPDLEARWINSLNRAESSKSYSTKVGITSRLRPGITANADYSYTRNWGTEASWSQSFYFMLSWRVSDRLSLNWSDIYNWDSSGRDQNTYTVAIGIAATDKIHTSFNISGVSGTDQERTLSYSVNLSWDVNRHVSLVFNYSGVRKEEGENPWNWTLGISASF